MRGLATWPTGHRPAPGGGLAVLVVVTVLAALAAPHAKAFCGRLAGGLPTLSAPARPAAGPAPEAPGGADLARLHSGPALADPQGEPPRRVVGRADRAAVDLVDVDPRATSSGWRLGGCP